MKEKEPLKSIICTTDFSDFSNYAVLYGTALARKLEAKLYVCHVIDLTSADIYGVAIPDPLEEQERIAKYAYGHLQRLIGGSAIPWEALITIGRTADEIARLAEKMSADLVISATHGRSGLKRLILGSVTERLMRTLPCPVLVVRSREQNVKAPVEVHIKVERILFGSDFSADSTFAFEYGFGLAREFQAELHLVHVIEPPAYKDLLQRPVHTGEEIHQGMHDQLNDMLAKMIPEEAYGWCTPKTALLAGQPHEEIIKYAVLNDVDLVVLGARGYGLVETLFLGSTTDRVARQAPCPVLSVRRKDQ